ARVGAKSQECNSIADAESAGQRLISREVRIANYGEPKPPVRPNASDSAQERRKSLEPIVHADKKPDNLVGTNTPGRSFPGPSRRTVVGREPRRVDRRVKYPDRRLR